MLPFSMLCRSNALRYSDFPPEGLPRFSSHCVIPNPLAHINTPTLVVHAVNDPVVAYEFGRFRAAQIPGARLVEVEDGGHFCCITHREKVVPAIIRNLNTSLS